MTFSSDELFLALVSLVRATRPSMLRQDADGFSIDFEAIAASESPRDSDRLLLRLGAAMQVPPEGAHGAAAPAEPSRRAEEGSASPRKEDSPAAGDAVSIDITGADAHQLAGALVKLEQLQAWPEDVLAMSRALRARLASTSAGGQ